jgi:hypothetical protein
MPDRQPRELRPAYIFLAYLREVPLRDWLVATFHASNPPELAPARAALEIAVRQAPDHRAVFAIQDATLNALQRFDGAEGRRLSRIRHSTDNLRPATEQAALAVLLRKELSAEQFSLLYAPFESLVPSVLLFGLP